MWARYLTQNLKTQGGIRISTKEGRRSIFQGGKESSHSAGLPRTGDQNSSEGGKHLTARGRLHTQKRWNG